MAGRQAGRGADAPGFAAEGIARHVVILGATGSIGRQALEVLPAVPQARVVAIAADRSVGPLLELAAEHGVRRVGLRDAAAAAQAGVQAPELAVHAGDAGVRGLIEEAAAEAASAQARLMVLNGIVGAAGLQATMATLEAGADLALANKESMVAGGPFVLEAARRAGVTVIPVDSEHSALFQCLAGGRAHDAGDVVAGRAGAAPAVEELLLTGSGGPFRGRSAADLAAVTPEQALAHPTWSMGPKITIDSATLMNKGLEVIEAHYLFGTPYDHITVVLNPQSVIHSMVRFADGAILAHLGVPDMRVPIGYALAYPARPPLPMVRRLDVVAAGLTFDVPDVEVFRCLALAYEAGKKAALVECAWAAGPKGSAAAPDAACAPRTVAAPIVLNAANEIAVAAFLERRIGFLDIAAVVEKCLTWLGDEPVESIDDVYACDAEARRFAREAAGSQA